MGCDICAWFFEGKGGQEEHEGRRGCEVRSCAFARHCCTTSGPTSVVWHRLQQHEACDGHRAASLDEDDGHDDGGDNVDIPSARPTQNNRPLAMYVVRGCSEGESHRLRTGLTRGRNRRRQRLSGSSSASPFKKQQAGAALKKQQTRTTQSCVSISHA